MLVELIIVADELIGEVEDELVVVVVDVVVNDGLIMCESVCRRNDVD